MSITITIPYDIAKTWAQLGEAEFIQERVISKACKEAIRLAKLEESTCL
jgi:hypothetical protein